MRKKPDNLNGEHGELWEKIHETREEILKGQTDFAKIIGKLQTNQEWLIRLIMAVGVAVVVTRIL